MEVRNIEIDIESVSSLNSILKNSGLASILSNYIESITQMFSDLCFPLVLLAMGIHKGRANHFAMEDVLSISSFLHNVDTKKENPKDVAEKLVKQISSLLEKNNKNYVDDASAEYDKLLNKFPEFKSHYQNLGLNAIVNSWAFFEAFSKDIWVYCLNNYPQTYFQNIANSKKEMNQEIEGLSNKSISISLLSKYNFNLSNRLGDLLSSKYDFTSINGIKRAYKDLFTLTDSETNIFENANLSQLEITRHIIVHCAGKMDTDYLKRSKRLNEKLGDRIILNAKELNECINSSIHTLKSIFLLVDNRINCS